MAAIAHIISAINIGRPAIGNQQQTSLPTGVAHNAMGKPTYATVTSGHASGGYANSSKQTNDCGANIVNSSHSKWSMSCSTPSRLWSATNKTQPGIDSESTDRQTDVDDEQVQPYTLQRSRKRRRKSQQQTEGGQSSTATRKGPLVIGVSTPSKQTGSNIKAAQKPSYIKKSIFCVGNVDPACSISDLCNHVTALSVEVISCYEAKPRRRRTDDENTVVTDRTAFRLCINSADCDKLLDDTKWPAHVYISEWYFKSSVTRHTPVAQSSTNAVQDNALRITNLATSVKAALNSDVNIFEILNTVENEPMVDDDETILETTELTKDGSSG
jgi:hypothetical protein